LKSGEILMEDLSHTDVQFVGEIYV